MSRTSKPTPTFRARVESACQAAFAKPHPVQEAVEAIRPLIVEEEREQARQYRVLRDLVERSEVAEAARDYTLMVAVHDSLLREGAFQLPGRRKPKHFFYFDEKFYVRHHRDVAQAVKRKDIRSGWEHFLHCGSTEGRIAHAPRIGGSRGGAGDDAAIEWERSLDEADRQVRLQRGEMGLGINFIGFPSANLGLGVTARNYIRLLDDAGLDVVPVDLPVAGRSGNDLTLSSRFAPLDKPMPHDVNLFVMNPRDIHDQIARGFTALDTKNRVNIALPFWELPRLPPSWIQYLNEMDVIIAASDFIKYMMLAEVDRPVVRSLGHPLFFPAGIEADRARFGIPEDTVAFVYSFDVSSDIGRKNPFAAIAAFEKALKGSKRATLVVKVNGTKTDQPAVKENMQRLEAAAARAGNVLLIQEAFSYREVMTLFTSCDVYVSLHRAEGLGLGMMEMMSLGKPIIATAWSGNMSFTCEQNSCLVGYDLVPVTSENQEAYQQSNLAPNSVWADARVDEAAHWMRRLVEEPELRARIGARAKADLADYQARLDVGELVTTVRNLAARKGIRLKSR